MSPLSLIFHFLIKFKPLRKGGAQKLPGLSPANGHKEALILSYLPRRAYSSVVKDFRILQGHDGENFNDISDTYLFISRLDFGFTE